MASPLRLIDAWAGLPTESQAETLALPTLAFGLGSPFNLSPFTFTLAAQRRWIPPEYPPLITGAGGITCDILIPPFRAVRRRVTGMVTYRPAVAGCNAWR